MEGQVLPYLSTSSSWDVDGSSVCPDPLISRTTETGAKSCLPNLAATGSASLESVVLFFVRECSLSCDATLHLTRGMVCPRDDVCILVVGASDADQNSSSYDIEGGHYSGLLQ